MVRTLTAACVLWFVAWETAQSQLDVSVDTLTIVESTTMMYQGQLVDYFLLDVGEAAIIFIEDTAFVKMLGFIEGTDTSLLAEATIWMKTSGAQVGDSWPGILPLDNFIFTQEEIVGTKMVTVGAGTFLVFDIGVWDQEGQYLGEKWYSDGIGLVGWELQICNETDNLQALDFDVSGAGFWPHALGDTWIFDSRTNRLSVDAPFANIQIDGSALDWLTVAPVVLDSPGDDTSTLPGTDISSLSVAVSQDTLCLMATFWDGAPDTTLALSHDLIYSFFFDQDGGGNSWGYAVGYEPAPVSQWYVQGINLPDVGARVAVGEAVEVSVPMSILGSFAFELPFFSFSVDSAYYDITCYHKVHMVELCPIALTGDVQGSGSISAADIVYLVNTVLKAGPQPLPCSAAGDVNCNGTVSTSDIVYLVNRVFKAGPVPCDACTLVPGTWTCP